MSNTSTKHILEKITNAAVPLAAVGVGSPLSMGTLSIGTITSQFLGAGVPAVGVIIGSLTY